MPHLTGDRILETTTSTGTGNITVLGALSAGYQTLQSVLTANGDTGDFIIASGTQWEFVRLTRVSANVYSRGTPYASSSGGAAVSFAVGVKEVWGDHPAKHLRALNPIEVAVASVAGSTDIGAIHSKFIEITGINTMTGFGSVPNQERFVRYAAATPHTHHATTFICPNGVSFTSQAGDTAIWKSDASGNWRCYCYQHAASDASSEIVNAQTGTTYTVLATDRGKLLTLSNAAAVAVTLPQASATGGFGSGWCVHVRNKGAGAVTITPTTSTIDGSASIILNRGNDIVIVSDGTNYQVHSLQRATFSRLSVHTANGSFTVPAGTYWIKGKIWAGGGGSGGNSTQPTTGGGGGEYAEAIFACAPGDTMNVVVGAGGTAGVNGGANGGTGGTSSIDRNSSGTPCTAIGGGGGISGAGGLSGGAGGSAGSNGVATSDVLRISGAGGGNNNLVSQGTVFMPGAGGNGFGTGNPPNTNSMFNAGAGGFVVIGNGLIGGAGKVVLEY